MAQVVTPQKKPDMLSRLLPIAGAVAGGYTGGPQGAMAGYSAGGAVGGGLSSATQKDQQMIASDTSSFDRRMEKINSDPTNTLAEAKQALAYMPPDIKEQYQKPIDDAYALALEQRKRNQERGMA